MGDRLKGKVAVVTGSSAGIGRASAELFAKEGATVVVSASGRRPGLIEEVAEGIIKNGGTASYCNADVSKSEEVKNLINFTLEKYGRVDVLMNNAITGKNMTVVEQEEDEWDRVISSSIKAAYIAIKASIPSMIENGGGSIINVSSVHGMLGGRNNVPYATVKAGLINMSRQIANDYGPYNIRVNAICPGRIVTESKVEFLERNPQEYRRQKCVYPLGRPGTMEECAYAALFLASDESSFITGIHLPVDGGLTCQLQDALSIRVEQGISEELKESGVKWP